MAIGGSGEFPQVQGWDLPERPTMAGGCWASSRNRWMGVGALAERIPVLFAILATLLQTLGFEQGSALPVCGVTARLLVDAPAVKEGDLVLVTGAAGMVGGFASQLARSRGAHVVAAARQNDGDEARRLGAQTIVNTGSGMEAEAMSRV